MSNHLSVAVVVTFATAIFLFTGTLHSASAYGYTNSTNTNHTNSSSVVNGNSRVSAKPSALTGQTRISTVNVEFRATSPCLGAGNAFHISPISP